MPDYKILLTQEAICDIADTLDYIELNFGMERADDFRINIHKEIHKLEYSGGVFGKTQILYRNLSIHKKLFSPSIIFYILNESAKEIHILRVLREERNWKQLLIKCQRYTYPN